MRWVVWHVSFVPMNGSDQTHTSAPLVPAQKKQTSGWSDLRRLMMVAAFALPMKHYATTFVEPLPRRFHETSSDQKD
jgi:hypothetical protein